MYPTVSFFLKEVFGINFPLPIQSYGLIVAIAFITGAAIMSIEFKRKEREGFLLPIFKQVKAGEPASMQSIIIAILVGFILGFKLIEAVFHYSDFVNNPQEFILSARGNFFGGLIAGAAFGAYTWWDKNRKKLPQPVWSNVKFRPHQLTGNMLVIAGIFGILGAKIFHLLENFGDFTKDPIGEFFSFSGLTFLGGLVVGFAALSIFVRKHNLNFLHAADSGAVTIPLAYGIGRMACQVAGDGCWGMYNAAYAKAGTIPQSAIDAGEVASFKAPDWLSFLPDWLFAYDYPHNILNQGAKIAETCTGEYCSVLQAPVFPTPLYEGLMMITIFIILWSIRKRIKIPGMLFVIYLFFGGLERFLIEQIRVNNVYFSIGSFDVTQAMIIASAMMLTSITLIILMFIFKDKIKSWSKTKVKEINKKKDLSKLNKSTSVSKPDTEQKTSKKSKKKH